MDSSLKNIVKSIAKQIKKHKLESIVDAVEWHKLHELSKLLENFTGIITFTKTCPLKDSKILSIGKPNEDYIQKIIGYLTISCDKCNYERSIPIRKVVTYENAPKILFSMEQLINGTNVDKLVRGFTFHMESKVRLSGCKKHMKMLTNRFGKECADHCLGMWKKKAIYVAEQIGEYMDENDALVAESEGVEE